MTCNYCWIIGVVVTFFGQIINNFGANLVKYSHTISYENSKKSWLIFCAGWLMFTIGISFDFISFAFTAQSIIAAVASIQFISNLIFAKIILKEKITAMAIGGSIAILLGTVLIGIFGDHKSPLISGADLIKFLESKPFIIWIGCLFGIGILLEISYHIFTHYKKRHDRITLYVALDEESQREIPSETFYQNQQEIQSTPFMVFLEYYLPFVFCFTSAIVGVQTPLFGKSISLLLRDTLNGNNQFKTPYPYVIGALFCLFGIVWIWRYNNALKRFDILYAMPVITACYISLNIIGGGIYFEEFTNFGTLQWILFSVGGCLIVTGVVLITINGTHNKYNE